MLPKNLLYSEDHEWVRLNKREAYIGFTSPFLEKLSGVVKLELPEVGEEIIQTIEFGLIEGQRFVKEIYAPLSGIIAEINEELLDNLDLLIDDPYGEGWLLKINYTDEEETEALLNSKDYRKIIEDTDFGLFDSGEED